ncbi:MAG: hypothetical protein OEX77_08040 [Candidatus Bathyarchaeota archaeon]|nr:hypothetical protein [Candidatus Bathyarchaeota archaeon]
MKKIVQMALLSMAVLTVTYVSAVVYANADVGSNYYPHRYVLYAAFKYEADTPPTEWYAPEQLGIYDVIEYGQNGSSWLHIAVDKEREPFPLQSENPTFLYKDEFYTVSSFWVTPGLPENFKQWQIPIGVALGTGWLFAGVLFLLFLKGRKNEKVELHACRRQAFV